MKTKAQQGTNTRWPGLLARERLPSWPGITLFFTTRLGGERSPGALGELNLGTQVGDLPERVTRNRARVMAAVNMTPDRLRLATQVHGTHLVVAEGEPPVPLPEADGLITRQRGVAVAVLTADCVPVLLADPEAGLVAAVHSGWRGAEGGIMDASVSRMIALGATAERLRAVIGPCIRAPSYVVGSEVRDRFLARHSKNDVFFAPGGESSQFNFDLPGYVAHRLRCGGLASENIHDVELCTYQLESEFYSHRRACHDHAAPCGRQMGAIFIHEDRKSVV